ncbi:MAG: hypothetical protein KGL36_09630 [Gammaproteobacteria bacterium]|nr:hypothetical protein [Gammaproteobacteria bacterium]
MKRLTGFKALAGVAVASVASVAYAAPMAPTTPTTPVAAVWKTHQLDFTFTGFTTHYTCSGFESVLGRLLRAAGARSDARVSASCTAPLGHPEHISIAHLSFSTLVPLEPGAPAATDAKSKPVEAQWKTVRWQAHSPLALDLGEGDCELVDEFARRLLPLYTVRDVVNDMNCVPHQVQIGSVDLRFRVLAPLSAAKPKT